MEINGEDLDAINLVFKNNPSLDKLEAFKMVLKSIICQYQCYEA